MTVKPQTTALPTYRVLVMNGDAGEMVRAIERAIASVCSDGNSDVGRVAYDVVASLAAAGFRIVKVSANA